MEKLFILRVAFMEMIHSLLSYLVFQESERIVSKKEGIDFAREYGCLFLECSAKTRENVEQCFEELVLKVYKNASINVSWRNSSTISVLF